MPRHAPLPQDVMPSNVTAVPALAPTYAHCPTPSSLRLLHRAAPFGVSTTDTSVARSILVVDDEADIRNLVTEFLSAEGYAVMPAQNGAEALAVIERAWPALVLLDMRMPVLDGWAFARALQERHIAVPVMVMTAAVDGQRWADQIGAAACLSKPFDLMVLLAKVERLLRPRALTGQVDR
jgi:two-component system, chemotaxis family, chemotaxis protein CheY